MRRVLVACLLACDRALCARRDRRPPRRRRSSTSSSSPREQGLRRRRSGPRRPRRTCRRRCRARASCSRSTTASGTPASTTTSRMISGQAPNAVTQADCPFYFNFVPGDRGAPTARRSARAASTRGGEDGRRPARRRRADLEGLHGGHGHDRAATPRSTASDDDPAGAGRRPVRGAPQPVRLLPLDHRLARRARSTTSPLDQLDSDLGPRRPRRTLVHHAEPLPRRPRRRRASTGEPGGLASADAFLQTWVPKIIGSPAWPDGGAARRSPSTRPTRGDAQRLLRRAARLQHAQPRRHRRAGPAAAAPARC